ncbi:MAG TPA: metallophosphoesterase, partial [Blastocatellia bacterium]|nr:metallophosphoesterase [Blastocatellia bacterium]
MKPHISQSPISRRQFVVQTTAIGATLVGATSLRLAAREDSKSTPDTPGSPQEPLFRFIQINDLHVQSTDPTLPPIGNYNKANEKARWVIRAINREMFCPTPAFVIGLGDMIQGERLERLGPDLQTFKAMIRTLRCPFYPVLGNHEVIQQEHSLQHLKPYVDVFGKDRINYTFEQNGMLFIALNNSGGDNPKNGKVRRQWLQQILQANRKKPKIVLCHIPLLPVREQAVLAKSFGFSSYIDCDPQMLPLIEEYSDSTITVLSGHLHLTGMAERKGIVHLSLSGTASYPSDGAVVYEVYPDRIEAIVKAIPRDLAQAAPTLHGKPRYDYDLTDATHSTYQEYQCG